MGMARLIDRMHGDVEAPLVFVTRDFILDSRLTTVASLLAADGCRIAWGPAQKPPAKTTYQREACPALATCDLLITTTRSAFPAETLAAMSRLRGIVFPTIGTEAVEIGDADALGIAVAHGPTAENFESMAEATVMLILALLYDLDATRRVAQENLPRPTILSARMLRGKTIGLVGMGRIARGVVQRLAGWGATFIAYDPHLPPGAAPDGVTLVPLDRLLAESDVVSLHAVLDRSTRHLIGAAEIARMKPGAFLVNTARGGLLDEAALVSALAAGRLGGAAIDATEHEPIPADDPLRTAPNLILTPHMVGHTREIFDAIPAATVENARRLIRGEPPLHWRNPGVAERWRQRLAQLDAALQTSTERLP